MVLSLSCQPSSWELLTLLLLLLPLPGAHGDCGALPRLSGAVPETDQRESFPVRTRVTYRCRDGFVKIPGKSQTIICLPNSRWQDLEPFCGRSCSPPPRLRSARLTDQDLNKSYYPVGATVSYVCRPGYESKEGTHTLTCLEDVTWSEAPEFCSRSIQETPTFAAADPAEEAGMSLNTKLAIGGGVAAAAAALALALGLGFGLSG